MANQVVREQVACFLTAELVGNAFVAQYYAILQKSPALVHRFYQDGSNLGPLKDGVLSSTTSMKAIDEKIRSFGSLKTDIKFVDAQESYNGGVIVLVIGSIINKDDSRRGFTQTFFLAPQDKGYFVLNDLFRYLDDDFPPNPKQDDRIDPTKSSQEERSPPQENHIPKQSNGVYIPPDDGEIPVEEVGEEEEEPVAEVVDEAPNELQVVIESNVKAEEVPKKSYASIVMNDPPDIASSPNLSKSAPKIQEQQNFATPAPAPLLVAPTSSVIDDGNNQKHEGGDVHSIYVKNLPPNVTYALVEEEFNRFGPIRIDGIQIINNKGFYFGFVEFEAANAALSAIEASPVIIGGREVVIEEKRSTNSRVHGNRGRYQGRGSGSKAEGGRGRASFWAGRRSYSRGESNKNEFGNNQGSDHDGYQNRGRDGYQSDRMGNGAGQANRGGGYEHGLD